MTRFYMNINPFFLVLAIAAANGDQDTCAASPGGCATKDEADANTLIQTRVRGGLSPDLNAEDPPASDLGGAGVDWPEECRAFFTDKVKCNMPSLAMITSWGRVRMAFESCCLYGGHPNVTCAGIGYNMLLDETGDFSPDAEFCQQMPDLYNLHLDALKRVHGNAHGSLVQLGGAATAARQAQTIVERVRELSEMYRDTSGLQALGVMFGLTAVSLMSAPANQMITLLAFFAAGLEGCSKACVYAEDCP